MIRKIIKIDTDKCDGCALCTEACHENAIGMQNGKAVLLRDDYCDGLGDCLPVCPTGAISFEERDALPYNDTEVKRNKTTASALNQWPVQIKLVPVNALFFDGAHLLIAADCTAYAHARFHDRFMQEKVTLVGCPKLDEGDYADKLYAIFRSNNIKSITVVRMEVPCCGGMENAVKRALQNCGKMIPWQVVTLSLTGEVLA